MSDHIGSLAILGIVNRVSYEEWKFDISPWPGMARYLTFITRYLIPLNLIHDS